MKKWYAVIGIVLIALFACIIIIFPKRKSFPKEETIPNDLERPIILLDGDLKVNLCPNETYVEQGYEAWDNIDGNITEKVKINKHNRYWIYSVRDSSNNVYAIMRNFDRSDEEAPILTLEGSSHMVLYLNDTYQEPGYTASDNCDGDITDNVEVTGTVVTSMVGTYELKYQVSDHSGHMAEAKRTITVHPRPDNSKKVIYLTFDDGPSSTITPGILKILREENVKATFFVINHSDSLNYLIKQAYDEGHTVAIHSYSHNYRNIYASEEAFWNDLNQMSEKIESITGKKSNLIRFAGGSSNTVSNFNPGIMSRLTQMVTENGYYYFDWNISSGDAGGVRSSFEVYHNVVDNLGNNSNIVLMHDFENNYYTLNALRDIIQYGKSHGYTFLPITETTPGTHHKINN